MQHLLAGVGRSDITPAPGTPQGGWGAQTKQRSVGADLPLYATALVLSGSGETVAIVDVDAIGFDAEWTTNILNAISELTSLPRERIRFSCTHTHSGPNTFRIPLLTEGLEMALGYLRNLPHQIAGAVWQAMQNLVPVRVGASQGSCDINVNRRLRLPDGRVLMARNWEGAVDRTVRVLRFDDLEERPVATIVHYACHPTTMAWQDQHVTPDYPGMAKRVVEEQVGGTCLFLQGATGCIGPRRGFTGDLSVYRKLGKILGLEASKVALNMETVPREERLLGVQQSGAPIGIYEDTPHEPADPDIGRALGLHRSAAQAVASTPSVGNGARNSAGTGGTLALGWRSRGAAGGHRARHSSKHAGRDGPAASRKGASCLATPGHTNRTGGPGGDSRRAFH